MLILGGTAEARALASELVETGRAVVSSLAGRVAEPALPAGQVRIGGFGGADGLTRFLVDNRIIALVDATHPFAARMSANAVAAAAGARVPLARLARPGWAARPDAAGWTWVDSHRAAARLVGAEPGTPLLTTGRQTLDQYLALADRRVIVRVVEPPAEPLPQSWIVVRNRGPYHLAAERELFAAHRIRILVTKDSGGSFTAAKLDAAADLGVRVVVVRRPPVEPTVTSFTDVAGVRAWLDA